jgi:peptidoglycan/LPS O-acetylase OafA/YrhL
MKPESSRNTSLDTLRVIAVLLVILNHFGMDSSPGSWTDAWILAFRRGGWIGVDLFFVLSGFLVSGLMFKEFSETGRFNLCRFLIRRGFKIYPAFYVLIVVSAVRLVLHDWPLSSGFIFECLFLQNYGAHVWAHTWSLAVEEHFYILCAGLVLILIRLRLLAAIKIILYGVAGLCLVSRVLTYWLVPYSFETHFCPTHLRLDSLGFGVLLAYQCQFHRSWLVATIARWRPLIISLLVLVVPLPFLISRESHWLWPTIGPTLLYISFGLGMMLSLLPIRDVAIEGYWPHVLCGWIPWIGRHSYSIYLWHLPVETWGVRAIGWLFSRQKFSLIEYSLIYVVGSLIVGVFMAKIIELPVLRIRERYFPTVSGQSGNRSLI